MKAEPSQRSPGARRQESYANRQRAAGRRQRSMWLTDDEAVAVAALLEQLRAARSEEIGNSFS